MYKDPAKAAAVMEQFTTLRDEAKGIIVQATKAVTDHSKTVAAFEAREIEADADATEREAAIVAHESAVAAREAALAADQKALADDRGAVTAREENVTARETALAAEKAKARDILASLG